MYNILYKNKIIFFCFSSLNRFSEIILVYNVIEFRPPTKKSSLVPLEMAIMGMSLMFCIMKSF